MSKAYADAQKVLVQYGATMANTVEEVPFVTNMALSAGADVRLPCRSGETTVLVVQVYCKP